MPTYDINDLANINLAMLDELKKITKLLGEEVEDATEKIEIRN